MTAWRCLAKLAPVGDEELLPGGLEARPLAASIGACEAGASATALDDQLLSSAPAAEQNLALVGEVAEERPLGEPARWAISATVVLLIPASRRTARARPAQAGRARLVPIEPCANDSGVDSRLTSCAMVMSATDIESPARTDSALVAETPVLNTEDFSCAYSLPARCGWIGSAVVPELIGAGHQVVGLARSDAAPPRGWPRPAPRS